MNLKEYQILRNKQGIYFLYDEENQLVYIGQSTNMYLRLLEHKVEGKKKFSYFRAIEISDNDFMELMEAYLIGYYQDIFILYNNISIDGDFERYFMTLPSSIRRKYIYQSFIDLRFNLEKNQDFKNENICISVYKDFHLYDPNILGCKYENR